MIPNLETGNLNKSKVYALANSLLTKCCWVKSLAVGQRELCEHNFKTLNILIDSREKEKH